MSKKTISTIKELPDWFNLNNYEKSKNYTLQDWLIALVARFQQRGTSYLENSNAITEAIPDEWLEKYNPNTEDKSLKDEMRNLLFPKGSDLLPTKPDMEMLNHEFSFFPDELPKDISLGSIRRVSNHNVYGFLLSSYLTHCFTTLMGINYDSDQLYGPEITDDMKQKAHQWLLAPFDCNGTHRALWIDLKTSDEQIKKDLTTWLANQRKTSPEPVPKKNFSEADIQSWSEFQVLPYLDLILWAEKNDTTILQHVIAQALFPDAYALGSDVDPLGRLRTTKKKAEHLMEINTLYLLERSVC